MRGVRWPGSPFCPLFPSLSLTFSTIFPPFLPTLESIASANTCLIARQTNPLLGASVHRGGSPTGNQKRFSLKGDCGRAESNHGVTQ